MAPLIDDTDFDYRLLVNARAYVTSTQCEGQGIHEYEEDFALLHELCEPLLRKFAKKCKVPKGQVDDVLQEVWTRVIKALPTFNCESEGGNFKAWLFVQVRWSAIDQYRRHQRQTFVEIEDLSVAEPASFCACPVELYEFDSDLETLREALSEFQRSENPENFQLFVLRRFHFRRVAELATMMNLSSEIVRQRICRSSISFRRLLKSPKYARQLFAFQTGSLGSSHR